MSRNLLYKLKEKTTVPAEDTLSWAIWFEKADRSVAKTLVGNVCISTVFLGMDHSYVLTGKPLLFETLVFGGELDNEMRRYSTWEEAEKGHKEMVAIVEKSQKELADSAESESCPHIESGSQADGFLWAFPLSAQ